MENPGDWKSDEDVEYLNTGFGTGVLSGNDDI